MHVLALTTNRPNPSRPARCSRSRPWLAAVMLPALILHGVAQVNVSAVGPAAGELTRTLTLPQAVALAMQRNRTLQLARLGIADAEQRRAIARSNYYPHIKNESSALYLTALEGVVIPPGAFAHGAATGLIPSETVRVGQGAQNAYTSGTGLAQPLTQLLRVHAGVRAATADVTIADLESTGAENSIALVVHKLYFAILTTRSKLEAADSAVKAGAVAEQELTQAVAEGRALELARLEASAAWLEQKQASLTAQLALDDLTTQFDDVLGLPLDTHLDLDGNVLAEAALLPAQQDAVVLAKAKNPKVLSARQEVEKARASVTAAKEAYIPDITGIARYSYQSGVPLLVHNFGTFGGAVTYELFDGGAREARLKRAKVDLHIAELRQLQAEADVSIQLSTFYDEMQKLQQLIAVVAQNLAVRIEANRVTGQRLQQNAALASEATKAAAGEAMAQASLLEARLNLYLVQNQVKELLGQRPN